jgi:hypothetical protein
MATIESGIEAGAVRYDLEASMMPKPGTAAFKRKLGGE